MRHELPRSTSLAKKNESHEGRRLCVVGGLKTRAVLLWVGGVVAASNLVAGGVRSLETAD